MGMQKIFIFMTGDRFSQISDSRMYRSEDDIVEHNFTVTLCMMTRCWSVLVSVKELELGRPAKEAPLPRAVILYRERVGRPRHLKLTHLPLPFPQPQDEFSH